MRVGGSVLKFVFLLEKKKSHGEGGVKNPMAGER